MVEMIRKEPQGYYFESYSEVESHLALIRDHSRTIAYKRAIEMNPHLFEGKVVLDIGCGSGILSLFAAKAGAKLVIGIDASNMCELAEKVVKDNNFDEIIQIVHSKVEDLSELPSGVEEVDVIISEWMGLCLYHESMLATVVYARDKWLKKDGLIFPDKFRLYLAATDDMELKYKVENWNVVAGLSMGSVKPRIYGEALPTTVDENKVLTDFYLINELNLYKTSGNFSFVSKYSLIPQRDGKLAAFFTYFDAIFSKCHKKITLTTSPYAPGTHWGQTVFRFEDCIYVNKDRKITGEFSLKPYDYNFRDLSFKIRVQTITSDMSHQFTCNYVLR